MATDGRFGPVDTLFIRKLKGYIGGRKLLTFARAVGVPRGRLRGWLDGASPSLDNLQAFADATDLSINYWADDHLPALPLAPADQVGVQPRSSKASGKDGQRKSDRLPGHADIEAPVIGLVAAQDEPGRVFPFDPDGFPGYFARVDVDQPKSLEVRGESAWPFAAPGQLVVFDAGREGQVPSGALVVVEIDEAFFLKRKQKRGGKVEYWSINPHYRTVRPAKGATVREYPVVALNLRPKARHPESDFVE